MGVNTYTFCLPDIGEGVVEGEVVEWLKNVGDPVAQDEPVVVVMTDKATVELPAPYPGTMAKQYYQPGEIAIKDKPLYDIRVQEGTVITPAFEIIPKLKTGAEVKAPRHEIPCQPLRPSNEKSREGDALAIPRVRRMARDLGVDLMNVPGTGAGGRVTEEDVRRFHGGVKRSIAPNPHFEGDEAHALTGIHGLMARKMDQRNVPQFSYFEQADAMRLIEMRQKFKSKAASEGINISFMPFLIRALSLTIKKFPLMNATIDMQAGTETTHAQQNIGVAMATPQGLVVPILRGVEALSLSDLIRAYEALKIKALAGKLSSADMKGATITISNFGVFGGEGLWATPLISDHEVAILAVARIREAAVVRNHAVVVREVLPLSWSFDHRAIDGALAAHISHFYCTLLRDPATLL